MFILDLSGLTLQAGPRNIVKDEYTPGGSIVGQANLEMDGNEIGTIQHHPIHIAGLGYSAMAAMHQQPGSGESNRLVLFFIFVLFCFYFRLWKAIQSLEFIHRRRAWCQKLNPIQMMFNHAIFGRLRCHRNNNSNNEYHIHRLIVRVFILLFRFLII